MQAKELRIGNWINLDKPLSEEGKLIKVSAYHIKDILQCELASVKHMFVPITLTEEWLIKFGFDKGSDMIGECYFVEHEHNPSRYFVIHISGSFFMYYQSDIEIKHVHQLQNLYFALTGEELTISK